MSTEVMAGWGRALTGLLNPPYGLVKMRTPNVQRVALALIVGALLAVAAQRGSNGHPFAGSASCARIRGLDWARTRSLRPVVVSAWPGFSAGPTSSSG